MHDRLDVDGGRHHWIKPHRWLRATYITVRRLTLMKLAWVVLALQRGDPPRCLVAAPAEHHQQVVRRRHAVD